MPKPSIKRSADRRALRTRAALREAIVALMTERGWDEIAVQDVCERANIGRSTFYSHYANKEELLIGGLKDLRIGLQAQYKQRNTADIVSTQSVGLQFAPGLIQHAHEQRKLFRALIGRRSGYVVQQRFREMLIRLVTDELSQSTTAIPRQAAACFLAGGFMEILAWWVDQRTPLPSSRIVEIFNELAVPVCRPVTVHATKADAKSAPLKR